MLSTDAPRLMEALLSSRETGRMRAHLVVSELLVWVNMMFRSKPSFMCAFMVPALVTTLAVACGGDEASVTDNSGGPAADGAAPPSISADADGAKTIPRWARSYVGDIQIDGITSDARSDVYAAGYFVGRAEFDPAHVLESVRDDHAKSTKDIFVSKHAGATGAIEWVRHFGGAGAEGNVYDLVAGSDGTVVASGAFSGTVDFDGTVLTSTVSAGSGSGSSGTFGNMFVAGLDPATGRVRWVQQGIGNQVSGGNEVATDPSGGFVQVGIFGGAIEPGGTMIVGGSSLAFGGGRYDTYAAKLSSTGDFLWVTQIGGSGGQRGKAIATDAEGNVLVAGDAASGETRFAVGQAFTSTNQDFWVAKYGPTGTLLWFRSYASSGVDEVKGIGADSAGNVIVAASFGGPSIDIGGELVTAQASILNTGLVFALSPDGARVLWKNTITSVAKCCELETDARGHTFVSGAAIGPVVKFGSGGELALGGSPRGAQLTELGADGVRIKSWTAQGTSVEFGELSLLANGATAVAGSFEGGSLRFDELNLTGSAARTQFVLVIDR